MYGAWLRQGEHTKCAYRVSSRGTISVSVQVSDVASVYLFSLVEALNYESRSPSRAICLSESDTLHHIVHAIGLPPLDEVYLIVANRSAGRIEVRHQRQMVKDSDLG